MVKIESITGEELAREPVYAPWYDDLILDQIEKIEALMHENRYLRMALTKKQREKFEARFGLIDFDSWCEWRLLKEHVDA